MGSRVQVPFGPRKVLGVVTAIAEESAHARLKPILKVIGAQTSPNKFGEVFVPMTRWSNPSCALDTPTFPKASRGELRMPRPGTYYLAAVGETGSLLRFLTTIVAPPTLNTSAFFLTVLMSAMRFFKNAAVVVTTLPVAGSKV